MDASHPDADREVLITRVFDAPRELVWEVWTKPEHVRKWYGLRVLTMTECTGDLRVGGRYRHVLQDPTGNEFAFSGEYLEVTAPEQLVSTWGWEAMPVEPAVVTVTFRELGRQTEVTMKTVFARPEYKQGWAASGGEAGQAETLDRFAEVLAELKG